VRAPVQQLWDINAELRRDKSSQPAVYGFRADTYEVFRFLDTWLRETFLPGDVPSAPGAS
jgi:hypothetical protein